MDEKNFKEKYTNTNFLTSKLIDNFYINIENITKGLIFSKILEVGCGYGFSTQYLSNIFNDKILCASDFDKALIEEAKLKNPKIDFIEESIYNLQRDNGSFDLVIALEVLEHLDYPEKALKELERVSRQYCILSVPNEPLWRILNMLRGSYWRNYGNTPGHINHWSRQAFVDIVTIFFRIIDVSNPLPWTIILAEKYD